jgi:hypothetical protein
MPRRFERKSVELVTSTAESLKTVTEQFTQVAAIMNEHGMADAMFPWTQHQWDCLDVVINLANQCLAELPAQIAAKSQNRPSKYDAMEAKSSQKAAASTKRKAAVKAKTAAKPRKKTR